MEEILKIISGLCWSTVYIVLIYNGFKYKSYGMPLLALGLNFGWEFFYSFYQLDINNISLQRWINIFWFLLDGVIVYQYFKFGKQYFPKIISGKLFIPWSILIFASCFLIEYMFLVEFGKSMGARYAAFLQNLIMSFLFIDLVLKRVKREEFSMTVAICKCIGTLAPTILFGLENSFIFVIGLLCFVIDSIYIGILFSYKKQSNLSLKTS